jgi:hypothetical protein
VLAEILDRTEASAVEARVEPPQGLRAARVVTLAGRAATVLVRGHGRPIAAEIAPEVETAVVAEVMGEGGLVMVELAPGLPAAVVGALRTKAAPSEAKLVGTTVRIEAEREILLRAGRAAVRLREDGDVEVLGSRISAASRGVFRIVGRILRLN